MESSTGRSVTRSVDSLRSLRLVGGGTSTALQLSPREASNLTPADHVRWHSTVRVIATKELPGHNLVCLLFKRLSRQIFNDELNSPYMPCSHLKAEAIPHGNESNANRTTAEVYHASNVHCKPDYGIYPSESMSSLPHHGRKCDSFTFGTP